MPPFPTLNAIGDRRRGDNIGGNAIQTGHADYAFTSGTVASRAHNTGPSLTSVAVPFAHCARGYSYSVIDSTLCDKMHITTMSRIFIILHRIVIHVAAGSHFAPAAHCSTQSDLRVIESSGGKCQLTIISVAHLRITGRMAITHTSLLINNSELMLTLLVATAPRLVDGGLLLRGVKQDKKSLAV